MALAIAQCGAPLRLPRHMPAPLGPVYGTEAVVVQPHQPPGCASATSGRHTSAWLTSLRSLAPQRSLRSSCRAATPSSCSAMPSTLRSPAPRRDGGVGSCVLLLSARSSGAGANARC
eukprot:122987-Chlamydomonas_euryale.AAC.1